MTFVAHIRACYVAFLYVITVSKDTFYNQNLFGCQAFKCKTYKYTTMENGRHFRRIILAKKLSWAFQTYKRHFLNLGNQNTYAQWFVQKLKKAQANSKRSSFHFVTFQNAFLLSKITFQNVRKILLQTGKRVQKLVLISPD